MKRKPSPPKRAEFSYEIPIDSYSKYSLMELIKEIQSKGGDPSRIEFEHESDIYSNYCSGLALRFPVPESEEAFQARVEDYHKKLAKYRQWEKDHRQEIKAYNQAQQDKKRAHKQKEQEEKRQRLEKQKERIEKTLARLTE